MFEALEAQEGQYLRPDNSGPMRFLTEANYLDPEDPLENALISYKETVENGEFPTAAEQNRLIKGIENNELDSARELIRTHKGFVAAIAYPFKANGTGTEKELFKEGVRALFSAVKTYEKSGSLEFSDYAALTIHEAFNRRWPTFADDSFVGAHSRPMEGIYGFIETIRIADSPKKLQKKKEQDQQRLNMELTEPEAKVIPLLHLKVGDIAVARDITISYIERISLGLKQKLGGLKTKEELAVELAKRGFKFDILETPPREDFTILERQVAMRLGKNNKVIAEELFISRRKLDRAISSLFEKTQARSRAELAIMAYVNDFEPTEKELEPPPPPSLEEIFNARQQEILKLSLYMKEKDISNEFGDISESGVSSVVKRAMKILEVSSRTGLILELHKRGMKFDFTIPEAPIEEILFARDIKIAKLLHLPNEKIHKILSLDMPIERMGQIVARARKKIGARTRQELALIVEIFSEGSEALDRNPNSNKWRLLKLLGKQAIETSDLEQLLSVLDEREHTVISAHYLADRATTWSESSKEQGINYHTIRKIAEKGIQKMRVKLEEEF